MYEKTPYLRKCVKMMTRILAYLEKSVISKFFFFLGGGGYKTILRRGNSSKIAFKNVFSDIF